MPRPPPPIFSYGFISPSQMNIILCTLRFAAEAAICASPEKLVLGIPLPHWIILFSERSLPLFYGLLRKVLRWGSSSNLFFELDADAIHTRHLMPAHRPGAALYARYISVIQALPMPALKSCH